MHQLEGLVDTLQRQHVGDQLIDANLLIHVPVDDTWHIGAAPRTAKSTAPPDPAGDQLKRARCDLLACACHTDNDAFAPTLVSALEGLAHGLHIADALE